MSNELQADFIRDDKNKCVLIKLTNPLHVGGITVPTGFVSDGCSVPRLGWTIIGHPFHYLYIKEAVGHDYLYKSQIMSKIAADVCFFRQLKKTWLRIRRYVIFSAVFVFGWIPWLKHKYHNYKER